ncbi:unnamed protein product [Prunus brigantina]
MFFSSNKRSSQQSPITIPSSKILPPTSQPQLMEICLHSTKVSEFNDFGFGIATEGAGEIVISTHWSQTCVLSAKALDLSTLGLEARVELKNRSWQVLPVDTSL